MVENLTWKNIIESDTNQLITYCEDANLPTRGNEDALRERLLRHVLNVSLPAGDLFLEGKLNVNTATPEEMSLWPYMGETLIHNIMDYREKFGKFMKLEDLQNVKGIGPNLFRKLIEFVDISGKTHIKLKQGIREGIDMELIRIEEDIRIKAWELNDMRENLELDVDYLSENIRNTEDLLVLLMKRKEELERLDIALSEKNGELQDMVKKSQEEFLKIEEMTKQTVEKHKEAEDFRVQAEEYYINKVKEISEGMNKDIPWVDVMFSDIDRLRELCTDLNLPTRGDVSALKERILRQYLSVSLPLGELFLEGKLNINTATKEEMELWPYMGNTLISSILDYRAKYTKFNTIEDLMNVKGIGPNLYKKLIQFVDISGKTHIKLKKGLRADVDMEFMKIEEDIRALASDMHDMKDFMDLDMDYLNENIDTVEAFMAKKQELTELIEKLSGQIKKVEELEDLRVFFERKIMEITEGLDPDIPWGRILFSDIEELKDICEEYDLVSKGDERTLKERLLRHVLNISLPYGELFLEGKLNINTATPEEMDLWPFMGDTLIRNIMKYRQTFGKFNKVEDLMNVKGVGPGLFKKLIQFVDVSGQTHIKVKRGIRADEYQKLLRLEDDIRTKAWVMQDQKDHMDIDMASLAAYLAEMDTFTTRRAELEALILRLSNQHDALKGLKTKKDELLEMEKKLSYIAFGMEVEFPEMLVETVDIPVIIPINPEEVDPAEIAVILTSTDGFIRRELNAQDVGEKIDDIYSRMIFSMVPVSKTYNVTVTSGEDRYYVLKNYNPGEVM